MGLAGVPLKCVLAEDDAAMRGWLRVVLGRLGVSTHEAASGLDFLELLGNETDIDFVVSDVKMPSPSGLQVLAMARTAGFEAPFLLITAFGDEQLKAKATALHALVLDKPFSAADLIACVGRLRDGSWNAPIITEPNAEPHVGRVGPRAI